MIEKIKIIELDEVDSTNDYIKRNIKIFNENFQTVMAKNQTKGRGRKENQWKSEKDLDLTFSFVFYPTDVIKNLSPISLFVGLSVYKTINSLLKSDHLKIKWPNDILFNSRKLCGILCERIVDFNNNPVIIIGIGINVNGTKNILDKKIKAISLKNISEKNYDIKFLLNKIMINARKYLLQYQIPLLNEIRYELIECLNSIGKEVIYYNNKSIKKEGIVSGLSNSGYLIVKDKEQQKEYEVFDVEFID
ncbi:MAG: biotin--[acetyl-CoA-carboxylase] ligase [Spirochaetia bacterium]|nr:biotin--[acetyl-CoA-carboxylase] ligase [Spirochaetia bacterium]